MTTVTSTHQLTPVERDELILARHAAGASERQIASEAGCSRTTVWNVIQKAKAVARAAGVVTA